MHPEKIGRYEIKGELGRGGMAVVYLSYDPSFQRDVAIKLIPAEMLNSPTSRERFEMEAQAVAKLEHPNIVPVYDFGEESGQPYLVMRLMTGGSLADRVDKGPMSLADVIRIVGELAPALDAAHRQGIIHRDLKPSNILFDNYDNPYISDFGLARMADQSSGLTGSGVIGTPAYMAPEVARPGGLTPLLDIYALGVTVYQMLSGTWPYEADTALGVLMAHMNEPIPDMRLLRPDLPPSVQMVIQHGMAKDPRQRYQTAGALLADLEAVSSGQGRAAPRTAPGTSRLGEKKPTQVIRAEVPTPELERHSRQTRRFPLWLWGVIGLVVIVGGAAGALAVETVLTPTTSAAVTGTLAPTVTSSTTATPTAHASPSPDVTTVPSALPTTITGGPALRAEDVNFLLPVARLDAHSEVVNALAWVTYRGTRLLASASADHSVIIWDTGARAVTQTLTAHTDWVNGVAWAPRGGDADPLRLATTSSDNSLIIWDAITGQPLSMFIEEDFGLTGAAWSPDGRNVAVGTFYQDAYIINVAALEKLHILREHDHFVYAVAWSPDGAWLASASRDGRVVIWNSLTGQPALILSDHTGEATSVVWSPDGRYVAAGSEDRTVIVWDAQTGVIALTLEGARDTVTSVAWSPSGLLIAAGSTDDRVLIWNAVSGELLRALDGDTESVYSVAWSADGALLAAGSQEGQVVLWGVAP